MRLVHTLSAILITFGLNTSAIARDDFASCYQFLGREDLANKQAERELFIIIDQTVILDTALKRGVHKKIHRFLQLGDRITIMTFSSYARERYASITLTGKLDTDLDQNSRYNTSLPKLRRFDNCIKRQRQVVRSKIDQALKSSFDAANNKLPKTELVASLHRFGASLIKPSKANQKRVLIISDMLENSDILSFYKNGKVLPIDVEKAINKVDQSNFISDWPNAGVYVIGAGLLPNNSLYRSEATLRTIRDFWHQYFERSGARVKAWGQPELLQDIN